MICDTPDGFSGCESCYYQGIIDKYMEENKQIPEPCASCMNKTCGYIQLDASYCDECSWLPKKS